MDKTKVPCWREDDDEVSVSVDLPNNSNTIPGSNDMAQFSVYLRHMAKDSSSTALPNAETLKDLSVLDSELAAFSLLPRLAPEAKMMEHWKLQDAFPVLKNIVTDIISAPVTEVTAERLFSHLKFILNEHRSTLRGDRVEDVLFLRMNKKFGNDKKMRCAE